MFAQVEIMQICGKNGVVMRGGIKKERIEGKFPYLLECQPMAQFHLLHSCELHHFACHSTEEPLVAQNAQDHAKQHTNIYIPTNFLFAIKSS